MGNNKDRQYWQLSISSAAIEHVPHEMVERMKESNGTYGMAAEIQNNLFDLSYR
jgi:hypothetical protein